MYWIIGIIVYIVMIHVSLSFWAKYGKRIGFDYDVPSSYSNYNDWSSNKSAYTAFSCMWPFMAIVGIIVGIYYIIAKLCGKVLLKLGIGKNKYR